MGVYYCIWCDDVSTSREEAQQHDVLHTRGRAMPESEESMDISEAHDLMAKKCRSCWHYREPGHIFCFCCAHGRCREIPEDGKMQYYQAMGIIREASHSDLDTIDEAHDMGERGLTDPFTGQSV